ncbi:MAG: hypothetical protein GY850_11895 [bacterium]|nr:hypothetical protein [bacterium]
MLVWDAISGRDLSTLTGHEDDVNDICVADSGQWAVSASDDHTLKLWDLSTGKLLRTLAGHSGEVNAVAAIAGEPRVVLRVPDNYNFVGDMKTERPKLAGLAMLA